MSHVAAHSRPATHAHAGVHSLPAHAIVLAVHPLPAHRLSAHRLSAHALHAHALHHALATHAAAHSAYALLAAHAIGLIRGGILLGVLKAVDLGRRGLSIGDHGSGLGGFLLFLGALGRHPFGGVQFAIVIGVKIGEQFLLVGG